MTFTKITKSQAMRKFDEGKTIRICPNKLAPHNIWGAYSDLNKAENPDFDGGVNLLQWSKCNEKNGKTVSFYVVEKTE